MSASPPDGYPLLRTPRGALLRTQLTPAAGDLLATLVLAPGAAYGMDRPLMVAIAQACQARGIACWRFDWACTTADPAARPGADLSPVFEDLQAVIAQAATASGGQPLFVAGKSLGSLLAWRALQADAGLRGAVLLTPLCASLAEARSHYPGWTAERRPVGVVVGDRDPWAPHAVVGPWTAGVANVRCAVLPGDHGFEIGASAAPAVDAPAVWTADFVRAQAGG